MKSRTPKSNVIQFPKAKLPSLSDAERSESLYQAQLKVYDAWESTGKARKALAKEALAISEDCADAYLVLAEGLKVHAKRVELFRKAIEAGERALGKNWEEKYRGACWGVLETRPIMRAMCQLALELQRASDFKEALALYRKLMELNPNDNQGIRYLLAECLYDAKCDDELEALLEQYDEEGTAVFAYTKALYLFRKGGASKNANTALRQALKVNPHIPLLLSGVFQMPKQSPSSIGFGDESEALAYVMEGGFDRWRNTESATKWMAKVLASDLRKLNSSAELIELVLSELSGKSS